jgi:hypothetical protein
MIVISPHIIWQCCRFCTFSPSRQLRRSWCIASPPKSGQSSNETRTFRTYDTERGPDGKVTYRTAEVNYKMPEQQSYSYSTKFLRHRTGRTVARLHITARTITLLNWFVTTDLCAVLYLFCMHFSTFV